MPISGTLAFPKLTLELVEDLSPARDNGFLRLIRQRYRLHYPDGTVSDPFVYDSIDRAAIDAVVIAAHFRDSAGIPHVYLRSAFRVPLTLRKRGQSPLADERASGALWELPAGLVEPSEHGSPEGAARAAQRELQEELGFAVPLAALRPLGPSAYPAPGFVAEQHSFFQVEVAPQDQREPDLDGSALERFGLIVHVPLAEALELCRAGVVEDSKTELALRRLAEVLA